MPTRAALPDVLLPQNYQPPKDLQPPPGTEIRAGDKAAGTLLSVADGLGLAYLRFDRAAGELLAGAARVVPLGE